MAQKNKLLWYYCDFPTVEGILSHNEIWGNSTACLNDPSEYDYGFDFLRRAFSPDTSTPDNFLEVSNNLKQRHAYWTSLNSLGTYYKGEPYYSEEINLLDYVDRLYEALSIAEAIPRDELFVLCASNVRDSLNQFRLYGGESPHAIGFDASKRFIILLDSGSNSYYADDFDALCGIWLKVGYSYADFHLMTMDALSTMIPILDKGESSNQEKAIKDCAYILLQLAARLKRPEYAEEHEYRCVFRPINTQCIHYRQTRFSDKTSYIKAGCSGYNYFSNGTGIGELRECNRFDSAKLPIFEVIIGPNDDGDKTEEAIRQLCVKYKWENLPIVSTHNMYR